MTIAEIRIQGVRGIRDELPLDLDGGKSLVLRGDNGTGKSSIVAGLRWALRGEEAPLAAAKAGSEEAYRANVNTHASTARVTLALKGGGKITATPDGVDADEAGQALRAACARSSPFLLRRDLLQFLAAKPGDRFKYLEAFLDLEKADALRTAFEARARKHETEASAQFGKAEAHLRGVFGALPRDVQPPLLRWDAAVASLHAWGERLGRPAGGKDWEHLETLAETLRPLLSGDNLARRRVEIEAALARWEALEAAERPIDPAPLRAERDRLLDLATDGEVAGLLEQAAKHFERHATGDCPVCEQRVDHRRLVARLGERRSALAALETTRADIAVAGTRWRAYWEKLLAARGGKGPAFPPGSEALTARLDPTAFAEQVAAVGAPLLLAWIDQARESTKSALGQELASLPSVTDTAELQRLVHAIGLASEVRLAVIVAESTAAESAARSAGFTALHEAVRRARQDVAKELLAEIGALVREFYVAVHPQNADDEVTGPPAIDVQRHGTGTALVRGEFQTKRVDDPRWVYSDGHLDTVGICVFLALRRFRADRDKAADPKLMVLDDIVLSIDLGHGRRLLDLLHKRFEDHQVLIFTHNGLFFDWCEKHVPRFKRKAIARWTAETGPQLGDYPNALARLEQQMTTELVPKALGQAVVNVIEEWLAQARFEYQVAVPARRGEAYTLTEIFDPFKTRVDKLQKALGVRIEELDATLGRLIDLVPMRNKLSHHENEFAREYPLGAVRELARTSISLMKILYCLECASFAVPIPNHEKPEVFRCSCERIRVIRPSKHKTSQEN